ncbi:uncharacterized protein LOC134446751 [Engraulis encrasicolus]|uniref:uncharacterized protein LOC134446751 n=1 Tax=Engraulis encrasicolus TaxID=184585 RepID=UPI002FD32DAF
MWHLTGAQFRLAVLLFIASHDLRFTNAYPGGSKGEQNPSKWYNGRSQVDEWDDSETVQVSGAVSLGSSTSPYRQPSTYSRSVSAVATQPPFSSQSGGHSRSFSGPQRDLNQGSESYKSIQQNQDTSYNWKQQSTFKHVRQNQKSFVDHGKPQSSESPPAMSKPVQHDWWPQNTAKLKQQPNFDNWQGKVTSKSVKQNQQPSFDHWKPQPTGSQQATSKNIQQGQKPSFNNWGPQSLGSSQVSSRPVQRDWSRQVISKPAQPNQQSSFDHWKPQDTAKRMQQKHQQQPNSNVATNNWKQQDVSGHLGGSYGAASPGLHWQSHSIQGANFQSTLRPAQSSEPFQGYKAQQNQQMSKPDQDGYPSYHPAKPVQRWQQPSHQFPSNPPQQPSRTAPLSFQPGYHSGSTDKPVGGTRKSSADQNGLKYQQTKPNSVNEYKSVHSMTTGRAGKPQSQGHFSPSRGGLQGFNQAPGSSQAANKPQSRKKSSSWRELTFGSATATVKFGQKNGFGSAGPINKPEQQNQQLSANWMPQVSYKSLQHNRQPSLNNWSHMQHLKLQQNQQ